MYICICIYMYICICIYVYMYMYIYVINNLKFKKLKNFLNNIKTINHYSIHNERYKRYFIF